MEKESQKPNFWENKEKATEISQQLAELKEEVDKFKKIKLELKELLEMLELSEDREFQKEIEAKLRVLERKIKDKEFKVFLSGKYDRGNAILSIYSGAGGTDAQDWVTLLLRMYQRYCQRKRFKTKILDQSFGEGGGPEGRIGTKSVTLEIKGPYVFGFLKNETGVHRLVRISPFSAQSLRHTSFALVEVLPDLSRKKEIEKELKIEPKDLRIDTFRASGPGGQYVNKRESAVRVTHLSTNISVSCQSERLQGENKEKAMKILLAKLFAKKLKEEKDKIAEIRGEIPSAEWGNQIRSYVLHPYKLVKDLRTSVETSDVGSVLDGNLEKFIEAELRPLKPET